LRLKQALPSLRSPTSLAKSTSNACSRKSASFGGLDILVNNAGIEKRETVANMSLDDWNKVLSVNLTGQFLCAREAVR